MDPDPNQHEKWDPDPHQHEKWDPDPHENFLDLLHIALQQCETIIFCGKTFFLEFEPELLRSQPGVQPMSYTHPG